MHPTPYAQTLNPRLWGISVPLPLLPPPPSPPPHMPLPLPPSPPLDMSLQRSPRTCSVVHVRLQLYILDDSPGLPRAALTLNAVHPNKCLCFCHCRCHCHCLCLCLCFCHCRCRCLSLPLPLPLPIPLPIRTALLLPLTVIEEFQCSKKTRLPSRKSWRRKCPSATCTNSRPTYAACPPTRRKALLLPILRCVRSS